MIRIILLIVISLIEIGFISSFAWPWFLVPITLAFLALQIQYTTKKIYLVWFFIHGIALDYFLPIEGISQIILFGCAGIASFILARFILTNKSFYAILTNGLVAFFVMSIFLLFQIQFQVMFFDTTVNFPDQLINLLIQLGFLILFLFVFYFAKRNLRKKRS